MARALLLLLLTTLMAACNAGGDTETTAPSTSSSTTTSTSTSIPSTTTTAPHELAVTGGDPDLAESITLLYSGQADPDSFPAPGDVVEAFAGSEGDRPEEASISAAQWDEETELAVVEADDDVTLAVADPDWRIVGGWWPSVEAEPELGEFPKLVAVVGSDARSSGNRESARADSIHFVGIDEEGRAGIVGVPRDSWVAIPGAGNSKINASLAFGGPDMMMDTFDELTGLEFDGYMVSGFEGFRGLIDALGGLAMDVPRDFNDRDAKADIDAGEQILDAADALALARVRKTIPGGDFQRQEHGGLVMMAAQAMLRAEGPAALPELLAASRPHFSTDLEPAELLRLAAAVVRVDPDATVNVVAPGGTGSAGGASVVFLAESVDDLWADLADGSLEEPQD